MTEPTKVIVTTAAQSTGAPGFVGWSSSSHWWLLFVGVIAAVLCLPFIRTVAMGDEGVLLEGAERMLRGSRLCADLFEFLPPGGFVLTDRWLRRTDYHGQR